MERVFAPSASVFSAVALRIMMVVKWVPRDAHHIGYVVLDAITVTAMTKEYTYQRSTEKRAKRYGWSGDPREESQMV